MEPSHSFRKKSITKIQRLMGKQYGQIILVKRRTLNPTLDMMEYAIAQNRDERRLDINQTDSCGRRQGLWLEDDGYREVYYKDGVVDGIFRSYSRKTGTLLSIGWYCKGMLSGRWFYFDEQGKLLRIDDHPDLEGSPVWLANSYLSK